MLHTPVKIYRTHVLPIHRDSRAVAHGWRGYPEDMDPQLFVRTFVLGFTIAAAVGPIALLVIRRTIGSGWLVGFCSGAGVATADGLYGAVACFGLTAVADALVAIARPLGLVGGAALVVIGLRGIRDGEPIAHGIPQEAGAGDRSLVRSYVSTLALTLANPLTVLLFAAIVVSLGVSVDVLGAAVLTGGFALGSLAWWLILVTGVAVLRGRLSPRVLRWITVASGLGIATFGALTIVGVLLG
jgi:threonine/homoserine/homoserine lactone efflux protein